MPPNVSSHGEKVSTGPVGLRHARASFNQITDLTMLYAILCYHEEKIVNGWSKEEDDAVLAKRRKVQQELAGTGRMGPVVRLAPTSAATTIRANGNEQLVLDGPFAETKEQLLGFYLVDFETQDEVVEFAKRLKMGESAAFEIRPLRVFQKGELPATAEFAQ